MKDNQSTQIHEREIVKYLTHKVTIIFFIGLLFFVYSLVMVIKKGLSTDLSIMLFGSFFSGIGAFSYGLAIMTYSIKYENKKKSWWAMILIMIGFIPYLFGSYLVFYKGIWGIIILFLNQFSFWGLILALISLILGYKMVHSIWLISEIGGKINKKIKVIKDE